jgi:spore germination cell wall hydrolase CwlJ-like protein
VLAERKKRLAEQACLATAVYYEARSESELGQLAVAKVILNRVRDPAYPKSICGVVYQGADKGHGCQFSFACDGRAEQPRSGKAWAEAKQIASRAMAGEADVKIISTATHYHADYVQPRWAGTMKRLIKIGRHVFYRDS